ncbi:MAG: BrnT family toxin [Deltaproteobacteria bacterium]|nr:BrnT family toxin [Deltaproteobacteria bacterium]
MKIEGFIWLLDIVEKIEIKHGLTISEVENIFFMNPIFSRVERGHVKGEDLYRALGQADSGKYVTVFFIYKKTFDVLVISARTMTDRERKYYARKRR